MQMYYLYINEDSLITKTMITFEEQDGIKITKQEYEKAKFYKKFNPATREFYELKEQQKEETDRLEQIEQAIGALAEQVAKNTLIGGNE